MVMKNERKKTRGCEKAKPWIFLIILFTFVFLLAWFVVDPWVRTKPTLWNWVKGGRGGSFGFSVFIIFISMLIVWGVVSSFKKKTRSTKNLKVNKIEKKHSAREKVKRNNADKKKKGAWCSPPIMRFSRL